MEDENKVEGAEEVVEGADAVEDAEEAVDEAASEDVVDTDEEAV